MTPNQSVTITNMKLKFPSIYLFHVLQKKYLHVFVVIMYSASFVGCFGEDLLLQVVSKVVMM